MAVFFVHPSCDAILTGGTLYNSHILKQAAAHNFPMMSVRCRPGTDEYFSSDLRDAQRGDLVIWDSLFIPDLAARNRSTAHYIQALLLHYLPSENPSLSSSVRKRTRKMEAIAIETADVLMVTGHGQKDRIEKRYPGKPVYLLEPGVGPEFSNRKFYNIPNPCNGFKQLLTVANLTSAKGHMELVFLLSRIVDRNWHWHLVGSQSMDPLYTIRLRRAIDRLKLGRNITFHGVMKSERLVRFMSRMDIYISASRYESYGMALAEAVTRRLPIVTTKVGDATRMVVHGENGYLIPTQNLNGFRRSLSSLMANPRQCRKFRQYHGYNPPTWHETFEKFRSICLKISAP